MSENKNNQEPKKAPINPAYIYALIGLGFGTGIFTPISTLYQRKLPSFIPVEKPEIWNLEAQIKLFAHVAFFAGIVIFINSLIVANSRLLTRKLEPHKGTEPFFIAIMNQALRNNIEQTLPFLCSYLYWLVSRAKESDIELAYIFGFLFVLYRVLFVLGYMTGLFLPITNFRAIGFLGTVTVNIILIEESLGFGLLSWGK